MIFKNQLHRIDQIQKDCDRISSRKGLPYVKKTIYKISSNIYSITRKIYFNNDNIENVEVTKLHLGC